MKDAPRLLSKEEYVLNMEQRKRGRLAVRKDVPIEFRVEEFVKDMVQRCSAKLSRSRVSVVDVRKGSVSAVVTETEIVRYIYGCTMKSKCH